MLQQYFPKDKISDARSILREFQDDLLLDQEVSNTDAALLCTYMVANKEETNFIRKRKVKELFEDMGRDSSEFSKAVYEIAKRRDAPLLLDEEDKIRLTFQGKERVDDLLGVTEDDR